MAKKPEAAYTDRVNKKLGRDVYTWSISDRFTSGIPDHWYSGAGADLWVEYKWEPKFRRAVTPNLSALQRRWLNKRHDQGRNCAVIVGSPAGGLILTNKAWNEPAAPTNLLSVQGVASWIESQVREQAPMTHNDAYALRQIIAARGLDDLEVRDTDDGLLLVDNVVAIDDITTALEYINERFPQPYMPAAPDAKARYRLLMRKILSFSDDSAPDIEPPNAFLLGSSPDVLDYLLSTFTDHLDDWGAYCERVRAA